MIYDKRYLQFNDFVFDSYDMISGYSEDTSFKGSSTAYSYGHGSYRPFKSNYLFVEEKRVSMTITLRTMRLPCEHRTDYVKFAEQELARPGRLWAIKNNEIIWAFASVTRINPVITSRKGEVVLDVEFTIPGGVWHKADKLKTFVIPYNPCLMMECKGFQHNNPCDELQTDGDCCLNCLDKKAEKAMQNNKEDCYCCCVDQICNDMALCYHTEELQEFYSCETPYQLVYDCQKAEMYFGNPYLGTKLCTKDNCSNIIAGRFYSETDVPTQGVSVIINGKIKNPAITINGNTNIIMGEYEALRIDADGSVYELTECCEVLVDAGKWSVPNGMDYGWTINPRENSIIVDLGACCKKSCVFIQHDAITT